jgi:hypothetical protein
LNRKHRQKQSLEPAKTTVESHQFLEADLATSQKQFLELLPSVVSERLSTLGTGGEVCLTDLTDILTQWYDTLPLKLRERFWMLSLDFLTLGTLHGMRSRELNFLRPPSNDKLESE